jgi:hypothetical protein
VVVLQMLLALAAVVVPLLLAWLLCARGLGAAQHRHRAPRAADRRDRIDGA